MPSDPRRRQRFTSLLANSLTALCLPLLVFELDRSHASGSQARFIVLLALTFIFAAAWPIATARSKLFAGLSRSWTLSVTIPCAVSTLIAASLALFGQWPLAYDLSGIVSLIIQLALFVVFFLPRQPESAIPPAASNTERP